MQKDVTRAIENYDDRQRKEALAKLEAHAQELGYASLSELTGGKPVKGGVPKFRNPSDPSQTWTGRGRQPNWVKEAISSGKSMDDLKIA
ncbi:MAG: H-NS histone family protein [Shimia sp.]